MTTRKQIVVIGGGAAGYFGAIAAAEGTKDIRVLLLEAANRSLGKVAISGGGRCNVTHNCFEIKEFITRYPRGGRELLGPFSKFQAKDTVEWFKARGVPLKAERDGRMFPTTDDSATIIHCLQKAAINAGVEIWHSCKATSVAAVREGIHRFTVAAQTKTSQEEFQAHSVLLATGSVSRGYEIARSLNHTIEPAVPSLFTFKVADPRLEGLSGISVADGLVRLQVTGAALPPERGPLLITHWGFSGPAVLKLSAWAARPLHDADYQAVLRVNWLPGLTKEAILQQLRQAKDDFPKRTVQVHALCGIPKRLWVSLVGYCGIPETGIWHAVNKQQLAALAEQLSDGSYAITGKGEFKEEFVTCGGIPLTEVDFRSMESKVTPGLYFAGEVLNIDGLTGGFNFQAAWTTGWLAGQALAKG